MATEPERDTDGSVLPQPGYHMNTLSIERVLKTDVFRVTQVQPFALMFFLLGLSRVSHPLYAVYRVAVAAIVAYLPVHLVWSTAFDSELSSGVLGGMAVLAVSSIVMFPVLLFYLQSEAFAEVLQVLLLLQPESAHLAAEAAREYTAPARRAATGSASGDESDDSESSDKKSKGKKGGKGAAKKAKAGGSKKNKKKEPSSESYDSYETTSEDDESDEGSEEYSEQQSESASSSESSSARRRREMTPSAQDTGSLEAKERMFRQIVVVYGWILFFVTTVLVAIWEVVYAGAFSGNSDAGTLVIIHAVVCPFNIAVFTTALFFLLCITHLHRLQAHAFASLLVQRRMNLRYATVFLSELRQSLARSCSSTSWWLFPLLVFSTASAFFQGFALYDVIETDPDHDLYHGSHFLAVTTLVLLVVIGSAASVTGAFLRHFNTKIQLYDVFGPKNRGAVSDFLLWSELAPPQWTVIGAPVTPMIANLAFVFYAAMAAVFVRSMFTVYEVD